MLENTPFWTFLSLMYRTTHLEDVFFPFKSGSEAHGRLHLTGTSSPPLRPAARGVRRGSGGGARRTGPIPSGEEAYTGSAGQSRTVVRDRALTVSSMLASPRCSATSEAFAVPVRVSVRVSREYTCARSQSYQWRGAYLRWEPITLTEGGSIFEGTETLSPTSAPP
eukprot:7215-Prorocentrum_minimum.AAC.1